MPAWKGMAPAERQNCNKPRWNTTVNGNNTAVATQLPLHRFVLPTLVLDPAPYKANQPGEYIPPSMLGM